MANIKPLHIVYGVSNYQWFHGDLKGRALALIVTLTGNLGKPGSGISTYAGQYRVRWPLGAWWGFKEKKNKWVSYLLWMNDEFRNGEEFKQYNTETPHPKDGVKAFIFGWGNPFDQHNMANRMREKASSGDLELIVACDFQMSTSCQWADVVLPGVAWYEKYDLTSTISHPYVQFQQPAIEPLFQCMPEIWTFKEIAKRLAVKSGDQGILSEIEDFYPDPGLFRQEEEARKSSRWNLKLAREIAQKAWNNGREFEVLKHVFSNHIFLHATEVVLILLAAVIFIKYPREKKWLIRGSLSVIVGVFAHRFLLIPPAYNVMPLRMPVILHNETVEWAYPIAVGQIRGSFANPQNVFASHWNYFPSIVEIVITVGVMAFIGLVFLSLVQILPIREAEQ